MSIRSIFRLLSAAGLVLLGSCGGPGAKPEFVLTYGVFFPATHVHARLARSWAEEIGRRSGGRIRVDVHPGGVLSGASETYECVAMGVLDLGMSCFSYSRGMFPLVAGLDLPWGYRSGRQATEIANRFIRRFQPRELEDCRIMYVHAHGPGILAGNRRVVSLKQIRGMNIRSTGVSARIARALGANAVGMGQGDTYEALRKGVVDGTLCPVETLKGWRQGEVVRQVVSIPAAGYTTVMFVAMNPAAWRRLPPDLRRIVDEANDEWIPLHGRAWDQADDDARRMVLGLKKEILRIAPEENEEAARLLAPLLERWKDDLNRQGLPGDEAFRFMKEQIDRQEPGPAAARILPAREGGHG